MSETAQRNPVSAPAAKLGGELRTRRQSLGWELPELSQSLRIRQPYLEAIEAGRMSELPGNTYALGFVRAYASALGLNGEQIAGRFRAESAEANIRPALSFPAPVPQRGVPAGALMLLGLLILGGSYAGWYYVSEHERTPAETVPPIPDRLLPSAEKPTPSPQVASILPSASPPAPRPAAPTPAPNPAPSSAAATQAATAPAAALSPAPVIPAPAAPSPSPPIPATPVTAGAPPVTPPPSGTRIVVKATADAWVTIKQPNGPPLLNKLMQAGETWPVPADKPGLTLTSGNAGGTELDVDTTQIATLGPSGAVRRDLKLDPDALKAGPLPPIAHGHVKPAAAPQG
jgi:cytoskeleton protein RodZ